jgi:hypothetical protein
MIRFQVGDEVQIEGLHTSQWRGLRGVVVKTFERPGDEGTDAIQECAVQFPFERRWFQSNELVRATPDRWIRFFRAEVLERWNALGSNDVALLAGDREELIQLLQERYGFARRRAEAEVNDFVSLFHKRMQAATGEEACAAGRPSSRSPAA